MRNPPPLTQFNSHFTQKDEMNTNLHIAIINMLTARHAKQAISKTICRFVIYNKLIISKGKKAGNDLLCFNGFYNS